MTLTLPFKKTDVLRELALLIISVSTALVVYLVVVEPILVAWRGGPDTTRLLTLFIVIQLFGITLFAVVRGGKVGFVTIMVQCHIALLLSYTLLPSIVSEEFVGAMEWAQRFGLYTLAVLDIILLARAIGAADIL